MTPVIVKLVARRRFPGLEAGRGGSALVGVFAAVGATLAADAGRITCRSCSSRRWCSSCRR